MAETLDDLDGRIDALRAQVRQALREQDREQVRLLRAQLRAAERQWHSLAEREELAERQEQSGQTERDGRTGQPPGGSTPQPVRLLLPLREQVHQALTLLTVPAAPRLISTVHEAFFAGAIPGTRLTSLRRDEERSFRTAPFARPYYLCAALTADYLAPVRGLLAVSTWPIERRVIGSLSSRVDYLTAAVQIAEYVRRISEPGREATRLLWQFAANIPGAARGERVDSAVIAEAARSELAVHADADADARRAAAARARQQLDDAQQLFGTRLGHASRAGTGA